MLTKLQMVEFAVLMLWSLLWCWATFKGLNIPTSVSAAYIGFVGMAAIKVTFGS